MGRAPKRVSPYQIVSKKGKVNFYIRGTYRGHRLDTSTGEADESLAARVASEMWGAHQQRVDSGRIKLSADAKSRERLGFPVVATSWMLSKGHRSDTTKGLVHRVSMLTRYFPLVTDCTTQSVEAFIFKRLSIVQRDTVLKDQRTLRQILKHAKRTGLIAAVPQWELPDTAERGTQHKRAREASVVAKPHQIAKLLTLLPERSRNQKLPVRALCTLLWETGLRPGALYRMTSPRHWRPGSKLLNITRDISKIGLARKVEVTPAAIAALTELHGLYFGETGAEIDVDGEFLLAPAWGPSGILKTPDMRKPLLKAAVQVLGEETGARFHPSCFRPSRITQLLKLNRAPAVVGRVVGQTSSSIQDRYLKLDDEDCFGIFDGIGAQNVGPERKVS